MTIAGVLLAAGSGSRFAGSTHKLRATLGSRPVLRWSLDAITQAGFDEVVVVIGEDDFADILGEAEVTVVPSARWADGQSWSVRAALDHCAENGHHAVVIGLADQPFIGLRPWLQVRDHTSSPIGAATFGGARRPPTFLDRSVWDMVVPSDDQGARQVMGAHPELVVEVPCPGDPSDIDTAEAHQGMNEQLDADLAAVTTLLGRSPQGPFEVVVRSAVGAPVVLKNHPILDDGRPMPTLYWLCGDHEQTVVGRLESMGGVRRAEAELGLDVINAAHARYEAERDVLVAAISPPPAYLPSGGVGGTRNGVKCLHAHYGWWLAGGDDPVGQWVADHLDEVDHSSWPAPRDEGTAGD